MTTYNTGNPIGSVDVKDLYDNAQNLDRLVNDRSAEQWLDRLNQPRKSWWGMEQDFYQFLLNSQFEYPPLNYVDGTPLTVNRATQVIQRAGQLYRVRLPSAFPLTLSGTWATDAPLLSAMNDTSLRQDLADLTASLGATLVWRATRQIFTVAELRTIAGRYDKDMAELIGYFSTNPGIGGGLLYWDAASTATDDGGTVFAVTGVPTGRWRRYMPDKTVYVEWFGIVGDGVTTEDAKLRAAAAAVPVGGTIVFPDRKMTVLVDIPAGQSSRWQDAVTFSKSDVTVIGSHSCLFKLKDFCSAWTADVGVTALNVFRVSASRVTVRGLNVDANADHHYETDGSGYKWWEEGPTGTMTRRPANGIAVCIEDGADMITDVLIEDNVIDRPLGGVYVAGNISFAAGTSLNDPNVYNGVLKTNVLERITVRGNRTSNCRGNDFVFIAGVRNSCGEDNVSVNSMYHQGRAYAGVVGITIRNNRAYMSYTDMATRWNATDLGYWRTNKPSDQYTKIIRCGYTIGSSSANTANNGGNVLRCVLEGNEIIFDSNSADGGIADLTSASMHCHWVWYAANGIHVTGNRAVNSPHRGIAAVLSILSATPEFHGVILSNNTVENCRREAIYSLGTGVAFSENNISNCGDGTSGIPVVFMQGAGRIYRNTLVWDRIGETHAGIIMQATAYGPTGLAFVSDNMIHGYTGTRMSKDPSLVVHGTDGGGVLLTLASGWAAGPDATAPARVTINCAGTVICDAQINSAAGGTDVFATLPAIYRPSQTKRQGMWNSTNTIQAASVSTAGALTMARGALAAGTTFYFNMTWPTDFRI